MSVLNRAAPSSVTAPGSQQMLGACDTFPGQEKASLPHCQLCKKCQHLLAALQQVGGLQTHGKSCCLSSAGFFQTVGILRVAQIQRQKATWETISSLLGGFVAGVGVLLSCASWVAPITLGVRHLPLAWQVVQLLCAVTTSTSFLLYKLHIQNDLDNTWQISWHPVVSVSGGPALPYGECRNTVCPTLSVCLSSAGMGLLRIALGRCLHRALFGAQGQCNPIIFLL